MLEVARRAEERGLDSVWVTDHVIVPNQANVIYREHMLDPLAILPWLAGVTRRIALGTSVVILPYRSPIPVAKLLASVDVLSGGRLIVGAAIGWLEGEFEALGVPFKERVSRSEEALELFRTLWTQAHPKIETKRHRLHDVSVSPMPLQKPRPPLYVGGNSEAALRRVARSPTAGTRPRRTATLSSRALTRSVASGRTPDATGSPRCRCASRS